jgi:hypothetical protein
VASAILHSQQLRRTFVELVIADRRKLQAHGIQRLDGRLVVKQARLQR